MSLLHGFGTPSKSDLSRLWSQGYFVLDTSVLLNLHRYREPARNDVLSAMGKVKDRLWIPFHVALEYERNRVGVIAGKRGNIRKVREKISELPDLVKSSLSSFDVFRRHSHVDPQRFLERLSELTKQFCDELNELENHTADVYESDEVRERVVELLAGRIGGPPKDQAEVSLVDKDGSVRYAREQPPGYLDSGKSDGKIVQTFSYAGLEYQRKFGDLYVWSQIKAWAATLKGAPVCFVTDDVKADWWWMADSGGPKRLGARPELKEEILREAGVTFFHMYTPDAFLEALNEFKAAGISQESVSETREISHRAKSGQSFARRRFTGAAQEAFEAWLNLGIAPGEVLHEEFVPDFVVRIGDRPVRAFEVIPVVEVEPGVIERRLASRLSLLAEFLEDQETPDVRLTFVCKDSASADLVFDRLRLVDWIPEKLILCAGYVDANSGAYKHRGCHVRASIGSASDLSE